MLHLLFITILPEFADVAGPWFQQDGATCNTANEAINLMKQTFVGKFFMGLCGPPCLRRYARND